MDKVTTPQYGYRPLNDTVPFTFRDSYTFLERINQLLQEMEHLTTEQAEFLTEVTQRLAAGKEATDAFMAEFEGKWNDVLASLVGYTIEVTDDLYVASMMDGSTFTAYTNVGVDNRIAAQVGEIDQRLTERFESFSTDLDTRTTNALADMESRLPWGSQYRLLRNDLHVEVDPEWPADHPIRWVVTQDTVGNHRVTFGANIDANNVFINPVPGAPSHFELVPSGEGQWRVFAPDNINASKMLGSGAATNTNILRALWGLGKTIEFEPGTRVPFTSAGSGISIAPGSTIKARGVEFVDTAVTNHPSILIRANVRVDELDVELAGGAGQRGVHVVGGNVHIGTVRVHAPVTTGTEHFRQRGFVIGDMSDDGTVIRDIVVDRVETDRMDFGVAVWGAERVTLGSVTMVGARQGLYIRDSRYVRVERGVFNGNSPNIEGRPGENAVIMEAVSGRASVKNIVINQFYSMTSGEHGFRIGGQNEIHDVWFNNCVAERAGAGGIGQPEPMNHGGCGFKVLGPTTLPGPSNAHRRIWFNDCHAHNLVMSRKKDNFAGLNLGKAIDVFVNNFRVSSSSASNKAAHNGIEIIGCQNVQINSPQITNCEGAGIYIYGGDSSTWGLLINVQVNNPMIELCSIGVSLASNLTEPFRRLFFRDVLIDGCSSGFVAHGDIPPSSVIRASVSGKILNSDNYALIGVENWFVSDLYYDPTSNEWRGRNGSTRVNIATGAREVFVHSNWVRVGV